MKEISSHFLFPSTIFGDNKGHIVTTILGTCISVCLWDHEIRKGAINHYMLPIWKGEGLATPKYGDIAIEKLIEKMHSMGSKTMNMHAKIFGGRVSSPEIKSVYKIGLRNSIVAFEAMKKHNITVVSQDVGGFYGRKLMFRTDTGEVRMKYIDNKK